MLPHGNCGSTTTSNPVARRVITAREHVEMLTERRGQPFVRGHRRRVSQATRQQALLGSRSFGAAGIALWCLSLTAA